MYTSTRTTRPGTVYSFENDSFSRAKTPFTFDTATVAGTCARRADLATRVSPAVRGGGEGMWKNISKTTLVSII